MKARAGSNGGGGSQASKSSKRSALNESAYRKAKGSEKRRQQIKATGYRRGK